MKTGLALLSFLFLLTSCKDTGISKPKNLIEEDKMVDIIYDLALLEGIKVHNPANLQNVNSNEFVCKKYKIDSLQFVKSTQFYASDISNYKKMYEEVGKRIEKNKSYLDSIESKANKK
ncbi:DUF4296 domain-containing protein [Flavobacterium psychrotolerans]|uniref:DUF4296 domain-containing protein n=1 Tax=Flavobacterium psychrotolerans TaxID=2169410 RepID=A0A2U1JKW0_9FLAO|nr:DUF4296 domain-containing protein [Flavobacterium psychrotolerans]PWA05614.1 DUF4296 domain-containing protein [Flavobacterium psychrotolerans]